MLLISRLKRTNLIAKTAELMIAALQVVSIRFAKMLAAGALPSASDQREFRLMGSEKVAAFGESWRDMNAQAIRSSTMFTLSMIQEGWRIWLQFAWPALAIGAPSGVGCAVTPLHVHNAGLDILEKGVAPIHRAAVANAERLTSATRQ